MPVHVVGYPSFLGGADTELWHVLRLWRRFGVDVRLIPTWNAPPEWRARCNSIGAPTCDVGSPEALADVPDLRGSAVISFCNSEFLLHAKAFRNLECRIIWVGCMTWMFDAERQHYAQCGPFNAYVFQSDFQMSRLVDELRQYGVRDEHCFRIPGPLEVDEFPFCPRPHPPDSDFLVGRIARPDLDKWSSNTWPIYGAIPYARRRARLMGWEERIGQKLGQPPDWAEVLPPCAEGVGEFLARLHCLLPINGGAAENWPRVGLEAMACGVPIVAQNEWGWREMIDHGQTGYLASNDQELAYYVARFAMDEEHRMAVAHAARKRLVHVLASPERIWQQWKSLFDFVQSRK